MSLDSALATFIQEARALLAEGLSENTLRNIGNQLRLLAQQPDLIPSSGLTPLHGTASMATLFTDGADGLTLMLAQFPDTAPTPVHNHNSWGVACVVSGKDRYQHFEQTDDGARPDHADLRVLYERVLVPGDIVVWLDPPHDIHAQQGIDGQAWELILFGKNIVGHPRNYYDLTTGDVRHETRS